MDNRGSYYTGSNSKYNGTLPSTSGYADRYDRNNYTVPSSKINHSSEFECHYCGKSFIYNYDLNKHYVYCDKRPGKYGA